MRSVKHKILELEVAVADVMPVAEVNGVKKLPEDALRLELLDLALRLEQLLDRATVDVLEHEVDRARGFDDLEQLDDMVVLQPLQDPNLMLHL